MTRTVAFLIFPDFQILDAAGPIAAFEIAARYVAGAYDLRVIAAAGGPVRSSSGVAMSAEAFDPGQRIDTLVVAGGEGTRAPAIDERLLGFVRETAASARRTASVCSGAYILAAAGLLDGRRATTHWRRSRDFARRFPRVRLEPDRIHVRDGPIWTSAGITAGIDLALALIAEDLGEAIARQTAQQLVVYHRRPGGQSQFSALLEMDRPGGRFGTLLAWARERLHEPLNVERLAAQAAMSPRNFARAFAADTGVTPARAVERLRVEMARERIEAGPEPIDRVARAAGFGDPERMRRAFLRAFGQPPQALRRAARV
ncbi:MAG TPA: GlxA family transcriptional regulator [Caulobacteraceae bacterium]